MKSLLVISKKKIIMMNYYSFVKTHNQLCCSSCLCKIKKKGNGQHADCDACVIEDIKEEKEKESKLKENISILENLFNALENLIN